MADVTQFVNTVEQGHHFVVGQFLALFDGNCAHFIVLSKHQYHHRHQTDSHDKTAEQDQ